MRCLTHVISLHCLRKQTTYLGFVWHIHSARIRFTECPNFILFKVKIIAPQYFNLLKSLFPTFATHGLQLSTPSTCRGIFRVQIYSMPLKANQIFY